MCPPPAMCVAFTIPLLFSILPLFPFFVSTSLSNPKSSGTPLILLLLLWCTGKRRLNCFRKWVELSREISSAARGLSYMTSTEFWVILTPSPSLSAKSILSVHKFGTFPEPPPPSVRTSYMEVPQERNFVECKLLLRYSLCLSQRYKWLVSPLYSSLPLCFG